MKSKKPLLAGIGVIIVIASAAAFLRRPSDTETTRKTGAGPMRAGVRSVGESRTTGFNLTFSGTVSAEGVADIAAKTPGTIVFIGAEVGQRVRAGAVLARIDNPAGSIVSGSGFRSADIKTAELAVDRARLSYEEARREDRNTSTRATELSKDLAKKNLETTEAELASLIDLHVVKSPIDGVVVSRNVAKGDTTNMGTTLFVVENGSAERTVSFYASESERALLFPGIRLRIFRNPDDREPAEAVLKHISPTADHASRRFLVETSVTDATSIPSGISVSVSAETSLASSGPKRFFLPLSAITVESSGVSTVFQNDGGIARRVAIAIVHIEGETAEVEAGLPDDTEIIVENAKRMMDGESIEAVRD